MFRKRAPLLVGTLLLIGLISFVTLYRSSPGELTTLHDKVAGSPLITDCKKCHSEEGLTSGCLACHSEIRQQQALKTGYHHSLFQQAKKECATCHSEHNGPGFAMINKASWGGQEESAFRHRHTTYTLTGAHVKLSCAKCHSEKFHKPFALPRFPKSVRSNTYLNLSQTCTACHADPHAGGFASRCTACHDQNKWRPAPLFKHEKFFPLVGVHATAKCSACHAAPKKNVLPGSNPKLIFGPVKGKRCVDCHASPHFTKWVESCEACHKGKDKTWAAADSRMTKVQHSLTGFRLMPPHQKATCVSCHVDLTQGTPFASRYPNPRTPGYRRFEKNCESCHKDEHRGQFTTKHPRCIDCHIRSGFLPTTFTAQEHRTYPLTGGHMNAACNACHTRDKATGARKYVPLDSSCAACHRDIHYGQFNNKNLKTICETCHKSTSSWSQLTFNHDTQSRFKLDKAHKNVACKECHPMVTLKSGARLVQYKPLRTRCQDCHEFEK